MIAPQENNIFVLNDYMDCVNVPQGLNEDLIRLFLSALDHAGDKATTAYWLMLCRIAEMSLLCAGHYADACEFTAAGDLLVNPEKIFIHIKGRSNPFLKKRHGKLSEQLHPWRKTDETFPFWFQKYASLEVNRKALLIDLYDRLEASGMVASSYLIKIRSRMKKIAGTIGFLASWQIQNLEDFINRKQQSSSEGQRFIHANLCNFSHEMFDLIGEEVRRLQNDPIYCSPIIAAR